MRMSQPERNLSALVSDRLFNSHTARLSMTLNATVSRDHSMANVSSHSLNFPFPFFADIFIEKTTVMQERAFTSLLRMGRLSHIRNQPRQRSSVFVRQLCTQFWSYLSSTSGVIFYDNVMAKKGLSGGVDTYDYDRWRHVCSGLSHRESVCEWHHSSDCGLSWQRTVLPIWSNFLLRRWIAHLWPDVFR